MYLSRPGQPFAAGHESAGVTAPALEWFLAEGATGAFFDLFVLIANPNARRRRCEVDYLLPSAAARSTKSYTVPRRRPLHDLGRRRADAGGLGAAAAGATAVVDARALDQRRADHRRADDVVAGQPALWYEAHNSPGATTTGDALGVAGGEVGGPTARRDLRADRQHRRRRRHAPCRV